MIQSVVVVFVSVLGLLNANVLEDLLQFQHLLPHRKNERPGRSISERAIGLSEVVGTELGSVQGIVSTTIRDEKLYAAYLGIRYGTPPVGDLRFRAPVPGEKWEGVKNATREGSMCIGGGLPQIAIKTSEDCLNLNVFTPVLNPSNNTEPKAVMVFIYGGGFIWGDDELVVYGPDLLIERDVVLVTFNYRLGAFGFLSLQNEEIPGNAALKDQVLALKFVKNNIANFGGDPNRIVIFGESAGSASITYHQLSEASAGLFNGAIGESGVASGNWAKINPNQVVGHAHSLGTSLNCTWETDGELLSCLRNKTAKDIYQASSTSFRPTIEPDVEGAFITREPFDIIESGDFNDVPTIIGMNSQESLLFYHILELIDPTGELTENNTRDLTSFIPIDLRPGLSDEVAQDIAQKIRDFYFNGSVVNLEQRMNYLTLLTDSAFTDGVQRYVFALAKKAKSKVYNYHFVYEGPFNVLKQIFMVQHLPGVCHTDELGYLFNDLLLDLFEYDSYPRNSTPHITIDRFTTLWTNLAKTGEPTPTTDDTVITTTWLPLTATEHNFLEISEELNVKQGLNKERVHFWNDIYELVQGTRPFPE